MERDTSTNEQPTVSADDTYEEPYIPDAPFATCAHALEVGSMAVYVTPDCPHGHTIRGKLACLKTDCRRCTDWVAKRP